MRAVELQMNKDQCCEGIRFAGLNPEFRFL